MGENLYGRKPSLADYSEDLRLRVVHAVESAQSTRAVSAIFQVSSSFVLSVHQSWKQTGDVYLKQIGGYRRALLEPYAIALTAQLSNSPSMTLKELQAFLETEQSLSVSISTIDKFLRHKPDYRHKNSVTASEHQREDVALAREQWQDCQKKGDLSKWVFLDETSASTGMIRLYGRALGGAHCRDAAPAGH
ncbi:MAG: hypothetical protein ACXV7F_12015 [Methylomonas sp.]